MKTKKELMDEMLQQAVEANNLKRAEELIKIGAEFKDLEDCIQSNMREMAGVLIQQEGLSGRDISKCLQWAVNSKYTEIIETILKRDIGHAHVRAWYSGYETPLDLAIKNNDMDMVKFLVELGVDVNNQHHNFGMRHQIMNSNITWIKFFIDLGAKLDNLLPTAVSSNNKDVVELLLENGAVMEKNLILHHVTSKEMAEFLISLGADVNSKDNDGDTPLHWSASSSNKPLDLIKFLIDSGADVNAKDNGGWSPLYYAVRTHNIAIAKLLIEAGADLEAKDNNGNTPIMELNPELTNAKKILKLLIAHGADVIVKGKDDYTLLHWVAKFSSAVSFIELLIKHGADVNAKDSQGNTPLHISAYNTLYSTSRAFIDSGADVFALNNSKETPEDKTSRWRATSKKIKNYIQNTVVNLSSEEVQRRKEKAMVEYDEMMGNIKEKEKEKEKSEKELMEEIEQMISALYEEEA